MGSLDAIFKAYDIRGVVPDQLDAPAARSIGWAFARFAGEPRVLVARDMRPSGEALSDAFADGAMAAGADVVDLGLASTDLIYFAAGHLNAPAAMFTASHNPARYNGIKLCLAGAKPVGQDTGLGRIRELVTSPPAHAPDARRRSVSERELPDEYLAPVRPFVDADALPPHDV